VVLVEIVGFLSAAHFHGIDGEIFGYTCVSRLVDLDCHINVERFKNR
jgi:hypothetical protein